MKKINAIKCKYIKLGEGGYFEEYSIEKGEIHFGFDAIKRESWNDKESLKTAVLKAYPSSSRMTTNYVNQIWSFYNEPKDTIWITFYNGSLYWAFAETEIIERDFENEPRSARFRKTIDGWKNTDINGKELKISRISGNLTKTAFFQGTICDIKDERLEYLLKIINGIENQVIIEARDNKEKILLSIQKMLRDLDSKGRQFEILVDLVFSRTGWQRTGELGGKQKNIDLEMYSTIDHRVIEIQIKSQTNQNEFDEFVKYAKSKDCEDKSFYYVYHTLNGSIQKEDDDNIKIIDAEKLSEMIFNVGLFNWLLDRIN